MKLNGIGVGDERVGGQWARKPMIVNQEREKDLVWKVLGEIGIDEVCMVLTTTCFPFIL